MVNEMLGSIFKDVLSVGKGIADVALSPVKVVTGVSAKIVSEVAEPVKEIVEDFLDDLEG
jgi:iron uptake system EfeUOB component EfeO/EfeM